MTKLLVSDVIVACVFVVHELAAIVQLHSNNNDQTKEAPVEHGVRKVVRTPISVMNHEKLAVAVVVVVVLVDQVHPRTGVDRKRTVTGAIAREYVWTGLLEWSSANPWIFSFVPYLVGEPMRVTRMTMLVHARVVVVGHLKTIDATTTVDLVASVMTVVVPIAIIRAVEIEIDRSSEHEVPPKSWSFLLVFYSYHPLFDECVWVSECSLLVFRAYSIYPRCCSPSSPVHRSFFLLQRK